MDRTLELLLLGSLLVLLCVGAYALMLWVRLWFIRQALHVLANSLPLQAPEQSAPAGCGTLGVLFVMVVLVLVTLRLIV